MNIFYNPFTHSRSREGVVVGVNPFILNSVYLYAGCWRVYGIDKMFQCYHYPAILYTSTVSYTFSGILFRSSRFVYQLLAIPRVCNRVSVCLLRLFWKYCTNCPFLFYFIYSGYCLFLFYAVCLWVLLNFIDIFVWNLLTIRSRQYSTQNHLPFMYSLISHTHIELSLYVYVYPHQKGLVIFGRRWGRRFV